MKFHPLIAAAVSVGTALALVEPTLPAWNTSERAELEAAGWIPGAILLTDEPMPDEIDKPAVEPLQVEPAEARGNRRGSQSITGHRREIPARLFR